MGNDVPLRRMKKAKTHFNPRSRMGSDFGFLLVVNTVTNFNPRSRMGSDNRNY